MESSVLVEVMRNGRVESRHRGAVAVVDPSGSVIASTGAIEAHVFIRSTAKPFQMVPIVQSGFIQRFGFTTEELAIMVASHSGEPYHTCLVESILAKAGLNKSQLRCGAHLPKDQAAQRALPDQLPDVLHNNCSGQHAGLLAYSLFIGAASSGFERLAHPSQQQMLSTLAEFSGQQIDSIPIGVDGCSLPAFAVPLVGLALAYARLVSPTDLDSPKQVACWRIVQAMLDHPRAVAGTKRLCTDLMIKCGRKLIAKAGAEGVYCVGVLPCERYPNGLGVAVKIEGGAERAVGPVVIETLKQLGLLPDSEQRQLSCQRAPIIRNLNTEITGLIRPVLHLAVGIGQETKVTLGVPDRRSLEELS
jgi:L-asparaginase II